MDFKRNGENVSNEFLISNGTKSEVLSKDVSKTSGAGHMRKGSVDIQGLSTGTKQDVQKPIDLSKSMPPEMINNLNLDYLSGDTHKEKDKDYGAMNAQGQVKLASLNSNSLSKIEKTIEESKKNESTSKETQTSQNVHEESALSDEESLTGFYSTLTTRFKTMKGARSRAALMESENISEQMARVLMNVEALCTMINTKPFIKKGDSEDVVKGYCTGFHMFYNKVIEDCNNCLSQGDSVSEGDSEIISKLMEVCKNEAPLIEQAALDAHKTLNDPSADQNDPPYKNWNDVIRSVRSIQLDENNPDLEMSHVGGANSDLIKAKLPQGTYYIKKDEYNIFSYDELYRRTGAVQNQEDEEKAKVSENGKIAGAFIRAFQKDFVLNNKNNHNALSDTLLLFRNYNRYGIFGPKIKGEDLTRKNLMETLDSHFMDMPQHGEQFKAVMTKLLDEKGIKENDNCEELIKTVTESLSGAITYNNSLNFMNATKIPRGVKCSVNNEVTYRISQMLGIKDLVARSRSCVVTMNGSKFRGNIMDEARGETVTSLKKRQKKQQDIARLTSYINKYDTLDKEISGIKRSREYIDAKENIKMYQIAQNGKLKLSGGTKQDRDNYLNKLKNNSEKAAGILKELETRIETLENEKNEQIETMYNDLAEMGYKGDYVTKLGKHVSFEKNYNSLKNIVSRVMSKDYDTFYSGTAKKKLCTMMILDFLLGQKDRHLGNYYVTTRVNEKGYTEISDVTAIDNDMCCGLYSGKELDVFNPKLDKNRLQGLTKTVIHNNDDDDEVEGESREEKKLVMPFMDRDLYVSLMSLKKGQLGFMLVDLLSPQQIESLEDRLEYLQTTLKNHKDEIKLIDSDEGWTELGKIKEDGDTLRSANKLLFNDSFAIYATKDITSAK